jgi:thiamine biosynthesis lipoprotein
MTSGASERAQRLTPRARALLPLCLALLVALTLRQLWCSVPPRVELSGSAMGTRWSLVIGAADRSRADLELVRAAIESSFAAVETRMSTWDPDSELSRFNRHRSTEPFPLSAETLAVLATAQRLSERTGGAFDVTVRPLVAAWGFGAGARTPDLAPSPEELLDLRARVGHRLLELDPVAASARKRHPELECDLSAIAKGWALDRAVETVLELGFDALLLELGGEVRVVGERPGGGAWRVAIERPEPGGRALHRSVELRDAALATSGDYRSFYEVAGERRSHLLDPRSGRPVEHGLASVSVVHAEAALADAWATALAVLGPDAGLALAEAEGLGAYFLERTAPGSFAARATAAFPPLRDAGGRTHADPEPDQAPGGEGAVSGLAPYLAGLAVFAAVFLAMSIGAIAQGRRLKGSCGASGDACHCSPLAARHCPLQRERG